MWLKLWRWVLLFRNLEIKIGIGQGRGLGKKRKWIYWLRVEK